MTNHEDRHGRFFDKEVSYPKAKTMRGTNYNQKFNKWKPINGNQQQLQTRFVGRESNLNGHVFGSTDGGKLAGVE